MAERDREEAGPTRSGGRRAWIFQANPALYDIDRALAELEEIHWGVPQHTYRIRPGDDVLIWRSGEDAGVIGVGKVLSSPGQFAPDPKESAYYRDGGDSQGSERDRTTRVKVRVRPTEYIPKEEVRAIPGLEEHQILTAPMGTVFPLTRAQWRGFVQRYPGVSSLVNEPIPPATANLPRAFNWKERRKSVYPLPGGYQGYLDTLQHILSRVNEVHPDRSDLAEWMHSEFGVSSYSARFQISFLERASLLELDGNRVELTPGGRRWLEEQESAFLIALIHSRIQLIGELLVLMEHPRTPDELLELANERYAMGWTTRAQIDRRRGWLESAGTIERDEQGRLCVTEFGRRLAQELEIHPPITELQPEVIDDTEEVGDILEGREAKRAPRGTPEHRGLLVRARTLYDRLKEAANNSTNPDEFEQQVAEAFRLLGFDSTWLGGSGKTDVLLVADLGPDDGYRVIIDCKTTAGSGISDQQVDWVTLTEHKKIHRADFVALAGPRFDGQRVRDRAANHRVTLIDVDTLGALLRQHARIPLGLEAYRHLFGETEATEGAAAIAEIAEEEARQLRLAAEIVREVSRVQGREGPLGARDLYWLLQSAVEQIGEYAEEEIDAILRALSTPGIGVLRPKEASFLTLGSLHTIAARLQVLAELILAQESGSA